MKRLVTCFCLVALGASCELARQTKRPTGPTSREHVLTVFLTGNELGALKPCGCSGGQLGGFDRRAAILSSVPKQERLIVDTGSFVNSDGEQDLIKFNTVIRALDLLDYDVVNLTAKDVETARNLGLLQNIGSIFNTISAHRVPDADVPVTFTKQFRVKNENIAVTIAAFDPESSPIEQAQEVFPQPAGSRSVNILVLTHCDAATIESVARHAPAVDCVICPADSDEPRLWGEPNAKPLVLSVGRYGRYVCRLQVTEPVGTDDRLQLRFDSDPVGEDLPPEPNLVRLYTDYQQQVKESNLLEKYPRFALPKSLKYVGSESCKTCHQYVYKVWSSKGHARAYATLEEVGSQFDPECVVCHVVGMEYESGFVSEEQTGHLKNVGCETCHGPGSEHILTMDRADIGEPSQSCLDCHTPEKSTKYAGHEQLYREKIRHWGEPNAAGHVE